MRAVVIILLNDQYSFQINTHSRVSDWVQSQSVNPAGAPPTFNTSWQGAAPPTTEATQQHRTNTLRSTSVTRNTMRTSPRSSGRHHKRSRSQERQQHQSAYNMFYQQQQNTTSGGGTAGSFTQVVFTFPQQKAIPYVVKCPGVNVTLKDVKRCCPKGGHFRFFFKTSVENMEMFQEEVQDFMPVPLFNDKVIVECRETI